MSENKKSKLSKVWSRRDLFRRAGSGAGMLGLLALLQEQNLLAAGFTES